MKNALILMGCLCLLISCQPEHEDKPNTPSPVDTTICDINGLLERHQLMQNMRTVALDPDFQMGVYAIKPIINPKIIYQSFVLLELYNNHLIKYKDLDKCQLSEKNVEIFGEKFSIFKAQMSTLRALIFSYTLEYSIQFDANPTKHKSYNMQSCTKPTQDDEHAKSDYDRDVYYAKVAKDVSMQAIDILKNEYNQLKSEKTKRPDFFYTNSMINYFCTNYDYTDPKEECTKNDEHIKVFCEEIKINEKIYGGINEK